MASQTGFCANRSNIGVALVLTATARDGCTIEKVADYTVTTTDSSGGTYVWHPIEYMWFCSDSGGGNPSDGGGDGPGPGTPPDAGGTTSEPAISIIAMDESNPYEIKMLVLGSPDITSTDVRVNGSSIRRYSGNLGAGMTVSGPSLFSLRTPGRSIIGVLGCRPDNYCAWDSFYVYRTAKGSGASSTMTATWADLSGGGTVIKTALYGFNLIADWIETSYSGISPVANGIRVEFRTGRTDLGYNSPSLTPYPMYTATHWLRNLGPASSPDPTRYTQNMMSCSGSGGISAYNTWVSACASLRAIGEAPTAGVTINRTGFQVMTAKGIAPAVIVNNELEHTP